MIEKFVFFFLKKNHYCIEFYKYIGLKLNKVKIICSNFLEINHKIYPMATYKVVDIHFLVQKD